jgi:hypothetical protein
MTTAVAFVVVIASLVVLLVIGTEDMGSGHTVFANRTISGHVAITNRGINVQTDTNQDQGCEAAGGASGITNACTATSGPGSTQTSTQTPVIFICLSFTTTPFTCNVAACSNIGCTSISCGFNFGEFNTGNCTTNNGVELTSCAPFFITRLQIEVPCTLTKTQTVPVTGITQGGSTGG